MRRSLFRALPGLALLAALTVAFAPQASAQRTWSVPRAVSMYRFPVAAGQPVSIAGGVGAPGDPGHMEVGFALTEDGVIPQTERCDHYTHSGGEMHVLMHQLNPDLVGTRAIHWPVRCPPKKKRH